MTAGVVTDADGLAALAPEWEALWRRLPAPTPFQSPAWLLPWWQQFGTPELVVATLRGADGALCALLPAYVLAEGGHRKLLPIGAGLNDYTDALVAPDAPPEAAARLLAAALAGVRGVDVADFPELPPGAALREAAAPAGWRREDHGGETCPVLAIPLGQRGLDGLVSCKTLRKLRMNHHRTARIGGATVRLADGDSLTADRATLARLHGARWTARGEGGIFADPRVEAFHAEAAPPLLRAGLLRLAILSLEGRPAAACMALIAPPDRFCFYCSGFDADFAFYSPGTLLLGHLVESAIAEGFTAMHFLRGSEAYKYAWGATDRHNAMLRFLPR